MAPLIAIVGPTAAGKTELAIELALQFHGEIINADSRQVYREMDIGTAKPTPEERTMAPHHLLDILSPGETFGLGSFLGQARDAVKEIRYLGNLPMVVGGTGQYIWALLEDWDVPEVPPDQEFRKARQAQADNGGAPDLYLELKQLDPHRASQLDARNVRRVIRALEIVHTTGRKPSEVRRHTGEIQDALVIGLTMERQRLYQRIDDRTDQMMLDGLLEEVRCLQKNGYQLGIGALDSPGYREMGQHLAGELSLEQAIQRTKFQTHRLARRQYSWFKLNDPRIHWLCTEDSDLIMKAASLIRTSN